MNSIGATFSILAATQQDVFKSISDNVGESANTSNVVLLLIAALLLIAVLVVIGRRRRNQAIPKALNSPNLLLKEVVKESDLKAGDLKRLKALADCLREEHGIKLDNPLVLLLCPSLLAKAMGRETGR